MPSALTWHLSLESSLLEDLPATAPTGYSADTGVLVGSDSKHCQLNEQLRVCAALVEIAATLVLYNPLAAAAPVAYTDALDHDACYLACYDALAVQRDVALGMDLLLDQYTDALDPAYCLWLG